MTAILSIYRFLGIRGCIAVALALALGVAVWRADSLSDRLDRAKEQIAAMEVASEAARAAQQAVNDAAAARYQELAERADNDVADAQAVALDAADRYITANRVQPCSGGGTSGTPAPADSGDTGVPASLPADSLVAVSAEDVRACTAATTYALEAHNWATGLIGKSD